MDSLPETNKELGHGLFPFDCPSKVDVGGVYVLLAGLRLGSLQVQLGEAYLGCRSGGRYVSANFPCKSLVLPI